MANSFEVLKRQAVQLERQLEDKIARFQQVGTAKLLLVPTRSELSILYFLYSQYLYTESYTLDA